MFNNFKQEKKQFRSYYYHYQLHPYPNGQQPMCHVFAQNRGAYINKLHKGSLYIIINQLMKKRTMHFKRPRIVHGLLRLIFWRNPLKHRDHNRVYAPKRFCAFKFTVSENENAHSQFFCGFIYAVTLLCEMISTKTHHSSLNSNFRVKIRALEDREI